MSSVLCSVLRTLPAYMAGLLMAIQTYAYSENEHTGRTNRFFHYLYGEKDKTLLYLSDLTQQRAHRGIGEQYKDGNR